MRKKLQFLYFIDTPSIKPVKFQKGPMTAPPEFSGYEPPISSTPTEPIPSSPPNTRPNDRPTYNDAHRMRKGTNDRHNNTNRATRAIMRGTWPTTAPPGRTDAIGATRWAMQATPAHFRTSAGNAQHESSPTTTVSSPERLPTSTEYSGKSRHGSTRTGHGVHFALFVNGPHNTTLRENTPRNHKSTSLTTLLKHHNRSLPKHRNCAPTCRDVNHPRICTSGTTT